MYNGAWLACHQATCIKAKKRKWFDARLIRIKECAWHVKSFSYCHLTLSLFSLSIFWIWMPTKAPRNINSPCLTQFSKWESAKSSWIKFSRKNAPLVLGMHPQREKNQQVLPISICIMMVWISWCEIYVSLRAYKGAFSAFDMRNTK